MCSAIASDPLPNQKANIPTDRVIVGLTGSIGSGKSEACKFFHVLGAEIIDADLLAREVVAPGTAGLEEIKQAFGPEVIYGDGTLDRRILGKVVFTDPAKKKELEAILHPKIRSLFLSRLSDTATKQGGIIIYAVPLLFESGYLYSELSKIIVVIADKENCLKRVIGRDKLSLLEAEKRFNSQMPPEEKAKKADYIIENNGTREQLLEKVAEVYEKLAEK